jgi:hypothetical protein
LLNKRNSKGRDNVAAFFVLYQSGVECFLGGGHADYQIRVAILFLNLPLLQ